MCLNRLDRHVQPKIWCSAVPENRNSWHSTSAPSQLMQTRPRQRWNMLRTVISASRLFSPVRCRLCSDSPVDNVFLCSVNSVAILSFNDLPTALEMRSVVSRGGSRTIFCVGRVPPFPPFFSFHFPLLFSSTFPPSYPALPLEVGHFKTARDSGGAL